MEKRRRVWILSVSSCVWTDLMVHVARTVTELTGIKWQEQRKWTD